MSTIKKREKYIQKKSLMLKFGEYIEPYTERHDVSSFETKIEYKIQKEIVKNKFFLSIHFFIPKSFQLNSENFKKEDFYSDLINFMRFNTPKYTLYSLLLDNNVISPIYKIKAAISNISKNIDNKINYQAITDEIRLLGAIIEENIKQQFTIIVSDYKEKLDSKEFKEEILGFLKDIEKLQDTLRMISKKVIALSIPQETTESYRFAEEYISLQIQDTLTEAYDIFEKVSEFQAISDKMANLIEAELNYRKSVHSYLIRDQKDENAQFTYWKGILKKYTQGILYLDIKPKDQKSKALELFYSIAAGLAMFISLLIGFWTANFFEQNSFPFILGLVIAYMFKDRIKDNFKGLANKLVGGLFPDRRKELRDPKSKEKIGTVKETVRFLDPKELDSEIIKIRDISNLSPIEQQGKPENIIHYFKEVDLVLKSPTHISIEDMNVLDILRLNIKQFIRYIDDAIKYEKVFNLNTKKVDNIKCAKDYHMNLVFKSWTGSRKEPLFVKFKRVRVILNKNGVKDIKEIKELGI